MNKSPLDELIRIIHVKFSIPAKFKKYLYIDKMKNISFENKS